MRTESPPLFASPQALRHAFESGLSSLLTQYDELGTFMLALANAASEQHLWDALRESLRARFKRFACSVGRDARIGYIASREKSRAAMVMHNGQVG